MALPGVGARVLSGDETCLAEGGEEIEEAVFAGLKFCEAQLAGFGHVGNDFDGAAEVGVGVPGRGEDVDVGLGELVGFGDGAPGGGGIG